MKPKGLLIAVVLLAVLGGLTWWSNKKEAAKAKTPTDSSTKLLTIPDDQFQEIKIKKVSDEVLGLKRENGKWQMTAPKPMAADQDAAGSMVSTLANLNADKSWKTRPPISNPTASIFPRLMFRSYARTARPITS